MMSTPASQLYATCMSGCRRRRVSDCRSAPLTNHDRMRSILAGAYRSSRMIRRLLAREDAFSGNDQGCFLLSSSLLLGVSPLAGVVLPAGVVEAAAGATGPLAGAALLAGPVLPVT